MDDREIKNAIFAVLRDIAPEVSESEIDAARPIRDQIDLDSMDFLHFVIGMHERLHIDVPERDYARLRTVNDMVAYFRERLAG
jgi:acyl carrier protein